MGEALLRFIGEHECLRFLRRCHWGTMDGVHGGSKHCWGLKDISTDGSQKHEPQQRKYASATCHISEGDAPARDTAACNVRHGRPGNEQITVGTGAYIRTTVRGGGAERDAMRRRTCAGAYERHHEQIGKRRYGAETSAKGRQATAKPIGAVSKSISKQKTTGPASQKGGFPDTGEAIPVERKMAVVGRACLSG